MPLHRITISIPEDVNRRLGHLSVDLETRKTRLILLGVRALLDLLERGELSPDTRREIEELRKRMGGER